VNVVCGGVYCVERVPLLLSVRSYDAQISPLHCRSATAGLHTVQWLAQRWRHWWPHSSR